MKLYKKYTRMVSILLAFVLLSTTTGVTAYAEEAEKTETEIEAETERTLEAEPEADFVEFPEEGMPDIHLYYPNEDPSKKPETVIPDGTVLSKDDSFYIGFQWGNHTLDEVGIETGKKYKLCELPPQIELTYDTNEIPLYVGNEQFAVVHVDKAADKKIDVWISFLLVEGVYGAYDFLSCKFTDTDEGAPEDGTLTIRLPGGKEVLVPVAEYLPKGPRLEKSGSELNDQGVITWSVSYAAPEEGYDTNEYIEEKIATPTKLSDLLPEGVEYVSGSAKEDGVPVAEDRLQYDAENRTLTYTLPKAVDAGSTLVFTYDTKLTDGTVYRLWTEKTPMTLENHVQGHKEDGQPIEQLAGAYAVQVDEEWIQGHGAFDKTGSYEIDGENHLANWNITVHTVGRSYAYLRVEDVLGKGLDLQKDTIRINGEPLGAVGEHACEVQKEEDGTTSMILRLYQDGEALFAPDSKGTYTITYTTQISGDYFQQTPGADGSPILTDRDVENDAKLFWEWYDEPGVGPGEPPKEPSMEKGPVKPEGLNNTMLGKEGVSYDIPTHTLTWEVTVNPNRVHINSAKFADTLPNDGVIERDGNTYRVSLKTEGLEEKIKEALPDGASIRNFEVKKASDGRTIGFSFGMNHLGTNSFSFPIEGEIDAAFWTLNQSYLDVYNDAVMQNVTIPNGNGETELKQEFKASGLVTPSGNLLQKTSVGYDPMTNEMTWKLVINESGVYGLNGVTIRDTLPKGMTYIADSTKVGEESRVDGEQFGLKEGDQIVWKLSADEVEGKKVILTYRTKVDVNADQAFIKESVSFENKASLQAGLPDAKETEVTSSATVQNPMVGKEISAESGNKLSYTVTLNPHGVKLLKEEGQAQLYLKDEMSNGLVPDLDSIKLYKAQVSANNENSSYTPVFGKGEEVPLSETDVTYEVAEEAGGTQKQAFRVPVEDETAYILTYNAYVTRTNVELKNTVYLEGSIIPEEDGVAEDDVAYTLRSFGGAEMLLPPSNWKLLITKKDQDGNVITNPEDPAVFGLYTAKAEEAKLLESSCDRETGICTFSQPKSVLEGVGQLFIKEMKAPTGYVASEDFLPLSEEDLSVLKQGGKEAVVYKDIFNYKEDSGKIEIHITYEAYPGDELEPEKKTTEFTIYKDKACKEEVGKVVSEKGNPDVFVEGLKPGETYYVKQTDTSDKYKPNDTVYEVQVGFGTNGTVDVLVETKIASYKVEHYKQQEDGTYERVDADTETYVGEVGTEVTAAPKEYEDYTVNEEADRKNEGTGVIRKPAGEDEGLILKVYYDRYWNLNITKVDVDGNPIASENPAIFGLFTEKKNDALLMESSCDKETGICTFSGPQSELKDVKTLYVKEQKAPEGYVAEGEYLALDQEAIDKLMGGGDVEIAVTNYKKDSGKIEIQLDYESFPKEEGEQDPNKRATFTVYEDEECTKPIATVTSENGNPKIEVGGLEPGKTYYFKQTDTSDKYKRNDKVYQIKVGYGEPGKPEEAILIETKIAEYKVEHYKQQDDGSYKLMEEDTETYIEEIGKEVVAAPLDYEGYTVNENYKEALMKGNVMKPVAGEDGETKILVLKVFYDKEKIAVQEDDQTDNEKTDHVKTGDDSKAMLWVVLMGISLAAIVAGIVIFIKRNRKR